MRKLSVLFAVLLLVACGGGEAEQEVATETPAAEVETMAPETAAPEEVAAMVIELAEHNVACGCSIEGIGACGNYIEVDGKFAEIANAADMGLGEMEWCGKEGVKANAAGELQGDKFVAATLKVIAAAE